MKKSGNNKVLPGVLLVATASYAGMGPYVVTIVNEVLSASRDAGSLVRAYALLVDGVDGYYQRNIDGANRGQTTIITYANSKLHKLRLLVSPPRRIARALRRLCLKEHISMVHFLSGDAFYLPLIKACVRRYKTFLTVHDASAHEAEKSWHKMLRQKIQYRKFCGAIDAVSHLITNSRTQQADLAGRYPSKSVAFHPFPSLVTPRISSGNRRLPELQGIADYILFFGRIEKYKGVGLLCEAYLTSEALRADRRLVIAGAGELPQVAQADGIVSINRYIADDEVAALMRGAACVVFPYVSATQSGVLSLACYFQRPTVVSDVPFFMEHVARAPIALTFASGSVEDLQRAILEALQRGDSAMAAAQASYYDTNYRNGLTASCLMAVYTDPNTEDA